MHQHLVVRMFGNQHTQEPHNKNQARTSLRAFLLGYTLLDMIFLMMFISMFSLTLPIFKSPDKVILEDVLLFKKKLDSSICSCIDETLYINFEIENDAICFDFDTYIEIEIFGYIVYAIKRE